MPQAPVRRRIPGPGGQEYEADMIKVLNAQEPANVYELEDGSILTLRTVVTEVWRYVDQYDANGNPVYTTRSGNMSTVTAPDDLRRRDQ